MENSDNGKSGSMWKARLYNEYVSSGQANDANVNNDVPVNPYYHASIKPLLPEDSQSRILDLGCGHGELVAFVQSQGYSNVSGVDVSREQINLARSRKIESVECDDLFSYLGRQTQAADMIFLLDVLEHLSREESFALLDAMYAALKPNGVIVLHIPNAQGIFGMSVRYGDLTHEQAFSARAVQQCLRVCKFEEVVIREDKPVMHGIISSCRRILWEAMTIPFRILYAAESGRLPLALSQNILVTARKSHAAAGQLRKAA